MTFRVKLCEDGFYITSFFLGTSGQELDSGLEVSSGQFYEVVLWLYSLL